MGVSTETKPRKIQERYDENGFYCALNKDWLQQLSLATQGEATAHSMSTGLKPVLVQNPAIIIQPYGVVDDE